MSSLMQILISRVVFGSLRDIEFAPLKRIALLELDQLTGIKLPKTSASDGGCGM